MGTIAIRASGLTKVYRLGTTAIRYPTLREAIGATVRRAIRRLDGSADGHGREASGTIRALDDVSFEVRAGEVVGIIGRNGAGKSTLLKILSRITVPTTGWAEVHGRVGSLLEVGTGFHPELTGRENVFLNGAILGMRRREVARRFDEIIAFAEVEPFVDTPIKRYSSGMHLRLAFAVAAHLEPDILIVDEVLAVGDLAFQRKCLGRMREVSGQEGRTVLFVSHNLDAVQQICSRGILLSGGRIETTGPVADVIRRYVGSTQGPVRPREWIDLSGRPRIGTGEVRITAASFRGTDPSAGYLPAPDGGLEVLLRIESDRPRTLTSLAVDFAAANGAHLINGDSILTGQDIELDAGENLVRVDFESLHLNPGLYSVTLWAADSLRVRGGGKPFDYIQAAFELEVANLRPMPSGLTPNAPVTGRFNVYRVTGADGFAA